MRRDYTGCQAGLTTDGRCKVLNCKFLCFKSEQPDHVIEIMKLLCPRENQSEHKESEDFTLADFAETVLGLELLPYQRALLSSPQPVRFNLARRPNKAAANRAMDEFRQLQKLR